MSVFSFDSVHGFLQSWNPIARQKKISEVLREQNSDIITLQEVHTYFVLNIFKKNLDYPFVAYKKYLYGPKGGLVTFSKHPIKNMEYIGFKKRGSFFNSSFVAHIIQNGVLLCTLKDSPFVILNAHATPNLDHDNSKNNRFVKFIEAQLMQISDVIKKLAEAKKNVVLAGDLNIAKDSHSYKNFLKKSGVQDVFGNFDTPTQHQEYLQKNKKVKRIDYIFVKGANTSIKTEAVTHLFSEKFLLDNGRKCFLSDHIGLKASITSYFDAV